MVLTSLKEALRLLRSAPVIWLTGLVIGLVSILDVVLSFGGESFIAERIGILQFIVFPFFVGGMYGVIKTNDGAIKTYLRSGANYYFNILLPSILIFFAVILTAFLVVVTLTLLGIGSDIGLISFVMIGVLVPILFFTFFYDTAAVFEDQKVFESIRRSIQFVLLEPVNTLLFFVVLIVFFVVLAFAGVIVWTALLAGQLEPLTQMTTEQLQMLTPKDIMDLIGTTGTWISALIYGAATVVYVTFSYAFKATFFRRFSRQKPAEPLQGEYDEKGRWYKY